MGNCTVAIKKATGITPAGVAKIVDINLSSAYSAGGDTVTLASLGLSSVEALVLSGATSPGGHAVEVVEGATPSVAPRIKARDAATGTELAGNQSAESVRAVVYGDMANP